MRNVRNVHMPQGICDVVSSIGIGAAVADSIGYRAPARYRSNPINSPQTRCRSAKQLGLQMSSERQRGESCSSQSGW